MDMNVLLVENVNIDYCYELNTIIKIFESRHRWIRN